MPNKILFGLAATATILLSACGDEITEVTEVNEVGMMVIEKGEALPTCSSDNEGAMIYAVDSAAAYFCVNRKWTSMKGEKGDQGEPGKDGKDGEKGEKGEKGDTGKNGEKGAAGEVGTSCTMEQLPDSSGYKVLCGGDSVGVVLNGVAGEKGDAGAKGDQGEQGEKGDKGEQGEKGSKGDAGPKGDMGVGCSLLDDGNGSVKVTCGEGDYATTTTLYKAVCGKVPFDPEHETCDGLCGTTPFISTRYFCDDRDNQIYRFVTIDTQTWMAQNMNYKTNSSHCYNNDDANCETDGRLYPINDSLEVCPNGWHLPDTSEYRILINTAGGEATAGKMLKSNQDGSGIDAYGFSIVPAGYYQSQPGGSSFSKRGYWAVFWTRSQGKKENGESEHHSLRITVDSDNVIIVHNVGQTQYQSSYYSVRCIKD